MALVDTGITQGVRVRVNYNATSGKVTSFRVVNGLGVSIYAEARLTDGRTFGREYPPGTTNTSLPSNVITVSFDASGEPTYNGLASIITRVPA